MKAAQTTKPGEPSELYIGNVDIPIVHEGYVLVKVHAAGVNRADCSQRRGAYPPPPGASDILGLEIAGEVHQLGEGATKYQVGDRVMALVSGGGYAEYCSVPEEHLIAIPEGISFIEAAGIPEAFLTAYQAMFLLGNMAPGISVLIHAGASGVGSSAIQLVNLLEDTKIYVTAGSQGKIDFCKALGAKEGYDYKGEVSWYDQITQDTTGVDFVLDFVGQNYWQDNINILNPDGFMVILSFLSGVTVEQTNIGPLLRKRLTIRGSTLRARDNEYKTKLITEFCNFALDAIKEKKIAPIIDQVFPLSEVAEAHTYMESNLNSGKIILQIV